MEPVGLSQVNYHLQVLVRDGVAACEQAGAVAEQTSYLVTVLDAQALAVLKETKEWDRVQREATARGATVLQGGRRGE
jgi:hypothetical protein